MRALQTYRIQITTAWWWAWLYVPGVLVLMACGMTPDLDKVGRVAAKAVRARLVLVDNQVLQA